MKRSFAEFLQDILEAITEIESFMVSVSFVDFRVNREKVLAVVKLLEVTALLTTVRDSRIPSLPCLPSLFCPRWIPKTLYWRSG